MNLPNEKISQVHFQYVNDGMLAFMHTRGSPDTFFQTVLFNSAGGPGEVLISRSKPSDPLDAILPGAPRWDATSKSNTMDYWDTAFDYFDSRFYQLKLLDDVYRNYKKNAEVPTPDVNLVVYTPGSRSPVTIPLNFQVPDENKAQIIKNMPSSISINDGVITRGPMAESLAIKKVERVSGMKVVPEGIVFYGGGGLGFWLLPAKELEQRIQESRK